MIRQIALSCRSIRSPIQLRKSLLIYSPSSDVYLHLAGCISSTRLNQHSRYVSTGPSLTSLLSEPPASISALVTSKETTYHDEGIPTNKSRNHKKSATILFDSRAEAKLSALSAAKENATVTYAKYQTRLKNSSPDGEYLLHLRDRVMESHRELTTAYSQAIKYCSRILNNPDATSKAEGMIYEWIEQFVKDYNVQFGVKINGFSVDRNVTMKKKRVIKTIHDVCRALENTVDITSKNGEFVHTIAPPATKDYINILRAYSISKAKRKGEHAEALLVNMMELANGLAGVESKNPLWIKENIPNSKMFALAVKCYAGSTQKEAIDRINFLHQIHDELARPSQDVIPGLFINDPYIMLHSIKSLRNFHLEGEREMADEWLGKLHEFVICPQNKNYFLEEDNLNQDESKSEDESAVDTKDASNESSPNDEIKTSVSQIDVTSAYLSTIRLYARLRGEKGAATAARSVLDRMHEVRDVMINGLKDDNGDKAGSIAFIDIRENAYNLVLGMYRDSKTADDASNAVELLTRMIDAGRKDEADRNGVPLPTHQSFEYSILALTKMADSNAAIQQAERFIALMEEAHYLNNSATVYNALLALYTKAKALFGKPELHDKAMEILNKMKDAGKIQPEMAPNVETKSLVIKACAYSGGEDREAFLGTANKIFAELVDQEETEKSAMVVTDSCYLHMMLCSINHMTGDEETKKERVDELFSQACQRGLCSNPLLTLFRNNTSEENFRLTVGQGRLADHWIANVTSPKALYTDGSSKGAGKNARRHGKSTSNWAKKQQQKDVQRKLSKDSKRVKKMFKKM